MKGAPRVEVPPSCTALDLANTRVADGTAQALAVGLAANAARGWDQINTLRLQRNSIGDEGCSALAGYLQQEGCALEVLSNRMCTSGNHLRISDLTFFRLTLYTYS